MRSIACAAMGLFFAACGGATKEGQKAEQPVQEPATAEAPSATPAPEPSATPAPAPAPAPMPAPAPLLTPAPAPAPAPGSSTTATPQSVCAHVVTLVANEFATAGASMPDDQKKQIHDDCVSEAEKERTSDPKGWACDSSCLMAAKTFAAVHACKESC
jgi:hypothetical protein